MPKYFVEVTRTLFLETTIEADSKDEAREHVQDIIGHSPSGDWDDCNDNIQVYSTTEWDFE
jgi:hypothetical protein